LVFVGIDWAEKHHDMCIIDQEGTILARSRVVDGVEGISKLHDLVAEHVEGPDDATVGIELDRGLLVGALVAAGYEVFAINPLSVDRYRDRHSTSGAKSDPGDAKVLADIVRTDRHNHRHVAGDSELADAIKLLARTHQNFVWQRQRHVNRLRSHLREFYPQALEAFGADLASSDAVAVLSIAPTPELGRRLSRSRIASALKKSGRQKNIQTRAEKILLALRSEQLEAPATVSRAYGSVASSLMRLIAGLNEQIADLEGEIESSFEDHPDAKILRSLPGLGIVLGARVLAEFGDDRTRYADAKARRNYAGTSPITRASGKRRVVLARYARNDRLFNACYLWAFASLTASPGARAYYDRHRSLGKNHNHALRALANRLVAILHGCLRQGRAYEESVAWRGEVREAA
jgi:transposase